MHMVPIYHMFVLKRTYYIFLGGAGAALGCFRQKVKRGAAAMRQMMCLLNIEACKPVLVDAQTKSMNLKMSRIYPL